MPVNMQQREKLHPETCSLIRDWVFENKKFQELSQTEQRKLASTFIPEMDDELFVEMISAESVVGYLTGVISETRNSADDLGIELYKTIMHKFAELFVDLFDWFADEAYFISQENRLYYTDEIYEGF